MPVIKSIAPIIENPVNLDLVIQQIQLGLADKIIWLDYSFGKAVAGYEMSQDGTNRTRVYPHAYFGNGQYIDVGPNNNYTAHCFIQIGASGEKLVADYDKFRQNQYRVQLELIVLFDVDKIKRKMEYEYQHRFTEEIKKEIRAVLRKLPLIDSVEAIYETPTDVLRGYTYNETERQNFKHPFGGFKFILNVGYTESC